MQNISVDIPEKNLEIPLSNQTIKKDILRRPSHCTREIVTFMNQPMDKETKENSLDGLRVFWECRPNINRPGEVGVGLARRTRHVTQRCSPQKERISLPSLVPQSNSSEDMTELCNDYDALKFNIKSLYGAHLECMQLNGLFERILTLGSISATFMTTMLLALKDISIGSENHLYISECAISGIATVFVALNNKFENGAKKQQHLDIVNKLRKLEVEISAQPNTRENYNKYKSQFISDLGDVTIFEKIREKYEIDNLSDGLF